MRFLTTYSASRAGKTFCWDKLRCQFFQGGFSTTKKNLYQNRFSKKYLEVPFGGSRSQEVFARVRPQEPVLGPIAQACRCVWSCMCTSFFFFLQKAIRCAVGTQHTRHVCCLRLVYSVVLLCKENDNLVKLFLLGCVFKISMVWILRFYFFEKNVVAL